MEQDSRTSEETQELQRLFKKLSENESSKDEEGFIESVAKTFIEVVYQLTDINELRMWLISSLGSLPVDDKTKEEKFFQIVKSFPESEYAVQMLIFLCEDMPEEVSSLFEDRPQFFSEFFLKRPQRARQWFAFQYSGHNTHGGLALEQYLFQERDTLWDKLPWGRRPVPPCVAIHKPGVLFALDPYTILPNLPSQFWTSDPFIQSLKSGEFLQLDAAAFATTLQKDLLDSQRSQGLQRSLFKWLRQQSFSSLIRRLGLLIPNEAWEKFLKHLLPSSAEVAVEELLTISEGLWSDMSCQLVWYAVAWQRPSLLRWFRDDPDRWDQLHPMLKKLRSFPPPPNLRLKVEWVLLVALGIHWELSQRSQDPEVLEAALKAAGVKFESVARDSPPTKRRRGAEEDELMGWNLPPLPVSQSSRKRSQDSQASILYTPSDVPHYLSQLFVRQTLSSFRRK